MPKIVEKIDPATGRRLPPAVDYRGPFQYRVRKLVNGRRLTKTFASAREARRWLEEAKVDVTRGQFVDRTEAERNTLGGLIDRYIIEVSPSKRGADQEIGHLRVIREDEVCDIKMSQLHSKDVAAFRDRMKLFEYAPATIVRRLNLIAAVISHGKAEWGVNVVENAAGAAAVKRPKGADRKRERRLRSPTQVDPATGEVPKSEEERLFARLANEKHAALLVPLVRLAIETAARQGELCSLRWTDVDITKRVMVVRGISGEGSKNGEVRKVPLSTAAVTALGALPRTLRDKRCFPVDQNTLKVAFARAVRRANLADLTFHDLRHEATSRLAKIYSNPLELMRVTGHRTLSMLSRYYHAEAEELASRLA